MRGGIEKHIVDHEIEARGEVGHIATESLIGIYRYFKTIQVHTIVRREELLHIRVLIALHLSTWETLSLEGLEGLIAHGIHRLGRMVEDHLPSLSVEFYILLLTTHYHSSFIIHHLGRSPLTLLRFLL